MATRSGTSTVVEDFLDDLIDRIAARVAERLPAPSATPAPTAASAPEYLTTKQAAKALALSTSTLEGWRPRGEGPPWVRIGTAVRYPREGLSEWIATHAKRRTK